MVFDLELIVLPLLFGVISFFIPSRWVRTSALLFSFVSLGAAGVKLAMFDPNVKEYFINNPGTKLLGVTFNIAIDGFGLLMLALSNLVIFLVALSNYNRVE